MSSDGTRISLAYARGLLLGLSLLLPTRTATGQSDASSHSAFAVHGVTDARSAGSGRRIRTLAGALGGAVVGATAGYLIIKSGCRACDDAAPMLFGATVGAIAGATVGIIVGRQGASDTAMSRTDLSRREALRIQVVLRVTP